MSGVECDAVTVCGGEAVREGREERRRQHTRAQLLSQFRDAESREAKEDLKVSRPKFQYYILPNALYIYWTKKNLMVTYMVYIIVYYIIMLTL